MSDVLVIGGTGMLAGVVEQLVADGHRVLLPSRHPAAEPIDGVVPIEADWEYPETLRDRVAESGGQNIDMAVVWCHRRWHHEVVETVRPLLAAGDSPIIEVWGSTAFGGLWDQRPQSNSVHVMLGHTQHDDGTSSGLTHEQISAGVIGALNQPAGSTVVVGVLD